MTERIAQLEAAHELYLDLWTRVGRFAHGLERVHAGDFSEAGWELWRAGMARSGP